MVEQGEEYRETWGSMGEYREEHQALWESIGLEYGGACGRA